MIRWLHENGHSVFGAVGWQQGPLLCLHALIYPCWPNSGLMTQGSARAKDLQVWTARPINTSQTGPHGQLIRLTWRIPAESPTLGFSSSSP